MNNANANDVQIEDVRLGFKYRMHRFIGDYRTELGMLIVLIVFTIAISFASPYFLTKNNLLNVISQITTTGLLSIGMAMVIIPGCINLGAGAVLGFSMMMMGMYMSNTQNIFVSLLIALGIALACGVFCGYFVGYLKLPPFIVTMGVKEICVSLNYVISRGNSARQFPEAFKILGRGKILGTDFPYYMLILILAFALFIFITSRTKFGRYLYATGANEEAARLSGINTARIKLFAYICNCILCMMAGLIMVSRLQAVDVTYGDGEEMNAIAAAVVGGVSMSGGRGTIWGVVIGTLLIGFLSNILNLLGVNTFWQGTVVGIVIIVSVLIESTSRADKR